MLAHPDSVSIVTEDAGPKIFLGGPRRGEDMEKRKHKKQKLVDKTSACKACRGQHAAHTCSRGRLGPNGVPRAPTLLQSYPDSQDPEVSQR